MEERKIKNYYSRFTERLPLKGDTDIEYIKAKYYLLVEKFIEEYFSMEENISPVAVLDESFKVLANGDDDLDLGDFYDFQLGLCCLIIASINKIGGRLKVSVDFFADQFINSFRKRAVSFSLYTDDASEFILSGLNSVGISQDESIDLLEKAIDWAEANVEYYYDEESYIDCIVQVLMNQQKKGV